MWPQEAWVGTYIPGWKRRKALMFGASSAMEAGIKVIMPASARCNSGESSPSASVNRFLPSLSSMLICTCMPLPAYSS
ncbi:hypothetical protein D3C79_999790 [compost metagenome]